MIDNLRELNDVVTSVANRIIEVATGNTSSGQYYVGYDDVSDLISYEDYLQYFDFISNELSGREEILELDRDGEDFDLNCGLAWCKNYEPLPEEDFSYGYLDVRPAPSLSHLADIGRATVNHLVTKGPFANLYREDLGVTEADKDYVKAYQQTEPQTFTHVPTPMPDLPGNWLSYEHMLIQSQQRRQEGSQPIFQWAVNVYGQDISDSGFCEQHPQELQILKDRLKLPNHAPEFSRAGAFLYGKPALVYIFDREHDFSHDHLSVFHAQTAMMAAHLKKALEHYNVNITYGIETGDTSDKYHRPADEILAFVPADADPANIAQFEKDFSKTLAEMPLTQDMSWVDEQFITVLKAISGYAAKPIGHWLSEHPDTWPDVAARACEQLGARVGELQSDILAARNTGDEKRLESLTSYCSFTAYDSKDYLEDCLSAADRNVRMDFSSPVVLFTKPHGEGHKHVYGDRFSVPSGKLKAMLPDLGYEAGTPLEVFLNSYTCEVAKEVQELVEDYEKKAKPTLAQQMKRAEERRQDPEQTDKGRDPERGD